MSTKTNDPKQTAPETDPTAEDVKTDTAAPAAEAEEVPVNKADKKEAKKEKEPKEKERDEKKRDRGRSRSGERQVPPPARRI